MNLNSACHAKDMPQVAVKESWKYPAGTALALLLLAIPAFGQVSKPVVSCESLGKFALPDATITIAQRVGAGEFQMPPSSRRGIPGQGTGVRGGPGGFDAQGGQGAPGGPGGPPPGGGAGQAPGGPGGGRQGTDVKTLPAFCRIAATLRPTSDSQIKIEVWLPESTWNGKLLGIGGGGLAGNITLSGGLPLGLAEALKMGYASVNTDAGHDGSTDTDEGSFMAVRERMIDYGNRANHEMTVQAKAFIKAFYGVGPEHSYFIGCSLGSMQAINEAGRYPDDYDGVIAGALMNPVAHFNAAQLWPAWLAARDPAKAVSREKIDMIHAAVLKVCATPLSRHDGYLDDPSQCHFDPGTLLCKGADASDCLTAPQVEFMRQVYAGPVNPRTGESIFYGPAPGAEGELAGMIATAHGASTALYKYGVFQNPNWDWKTMDFDKDIAQADKVLGPIAHVDANLNPFLSRGGKLMIYIGWQDYHNPLQVAGYYNAVLKNAGPSKTDSVRLFIVPGMGHCNGGPGCDTFDKVGSMDKWLKTGKAPDRIVSSKLDSSGKEIRTRPLCAYPKVAKYKGTGSFDEAENFVCASSAPKK